MNEYRKRIKFIRIYLKDKGYALCGLKEVAAIVFFARIRYNEIIDNPSKTICRKWVMDKLMSYLFLKINY